MEDYAYVLDYLPNGKRNDPRREPLVQLIGETNYTLLEASLKPNTTVIIGERVYVGKGQRDKIRKIKGRLFYDQITSSAKEFLPFVLKKFVETNENVFVQFFNTAKSISVRVHTLELLPGIGKKHLKMLLEEREKKPFESFEDIRKRVSGFDPVNTIIKRLIREIMGEEKHNLFVRR